MTDSSPQSPEARRKRLRQARARVKEALPRPGSYPFEVLKRVAVGVYNDGFIHAGNLAYLSLLTVFPFFIVAVAIAKIFGRTEDGMAAVGAFLQTVPPGMLTADAFGVLPPIARLTPEQAMYHFLSGYTAKVAGTEIGVTEPEATFSTCFGAPFMPRHPSVYGNLLKERIAKGGVTCWLVNTGWTGGKYGVGSRMPIKVTRALLNAALDGSLNAVEFRVDENFGFEVPVSVPGVESKILDPRQTWADGREYDETAAKLVGLFADNFKQFEEHVDNAVLQIALKTPEPAL